MVGNQMNRGYKAVSGVSQVAAASIKLSWCEYGMRTCQRVVECFCIY